MKSFFFNDTATTEIYTLSLHDALPISAFRRPYAARRAILPVDALFEWRATKGAQMGRYFGIGMTDGAKLDRKSTRLNSSHANISYAVFCLKKNNSAQLDRSLNLSFDLH